MNTQKAAKTYIFLSVDRAAFCTEECRVNALQYPEDSIPSKHRVSATIAQFIICYGCGLPLDEVAE